MQENVNIPDSTITSSLTFRNLVLMNMQQLTNFPYIEKDFDALTDYELLCLVVKYLNDVIANQNEQNDSITNLYNAFLALQDYVNNTKDTLEDAFNDLNTYVNNYFNNVDWQDLVDNKLDEMVADGTLETIIGNYISIIGTNVKTFGAIGDGVTDDTEAIQDTIDYAKTNNLSKIIFPKGTYKITSGLKIDFSNITLEGVDDATLMYYGNGTTGKILQIKGTNAVVYIKNITINNLKINGTNQVYKGGYSMDTPTVTHTNPAYAGLVCISAEFVKNLKITNCIFNDVYGEGIRIAHSTNVKVSNNSLYDVSSGNIQQNGQTGYDDHGDGIVAFFCYNVIFDGNTVVNKRVYLDGISGAIGKPCGRSGLEFEYPINANYTNNNPDDPLHNAPDFDLIPTITTTSRDIRDGFSLIMEKNYVYGYTKGIHLENRIKTIIKDNTVVYNHIGIMATVSNKTLISGNYFNTFNIGPAPQTGYNGYYGCIAISEYGVTSQKYGFLVNNNIIEGDGKGIILGSSYVTISNNVIDSKTGIYTIKENLEGIDVIGNTFNSTNVNNFEAFLFLYHVNSALVDGNSFYSPNGHSNQVDGKNVKINNNLFFNTFIKQLVRSENTIFTNNIIKGDNFTDIPVFLYNILNGYVANNVIYATDASANERYIIQSDGSSTNTTYENNTIYVNATRTKEVIFPGNCEEVNINRNSLIGNGPDIKFITPFAFRGGNLTNNSVENPMAFVIRATGNYERIVNVDKNIGRFGGTSYLPNDSLARFDYTYFTLSQRVYKYNINASSTNIGWICVSGGWYVTTTWTTDTSYNVNRKLKNNSNNVYQCINKGSGNSTVEPTHTTNEDVTESDGYKWRYLGPIAVLKDLPL